MDFLQFNFVANTFYWLSGEAFRRRSSSGFFNYSLPLPPEKMVFPIQMLIKVSRLHEIIQPDTSGLRTSQSGKSSLLLVPED